MTSAISHPTKSSKKTLPLQPVSKQKVITQLKNHLRQKVRLDQQVKQSLYQQQLKAVQKQRKIQKQLQLINKQNQMWMSELDSFVKTIEKKKLKTVLSKQAKQQIELMKQAQSLEEQLNKIRKTKEYREKVQKQDWVQLDREKQKIAIFLAENKKKLINLARAKSTQIPTRKSIKQQKVVIPKQDQSKKPRKSKNIQQLKQLGRKYLQFAKKAQKSKSQRRLLKIQNKNIDYQSQMKQLIKMKVDDLSKKPDIVLQETMSSRKKKLFKNTLGSTGSMKLSSHEGFIRGNKSLSENKMRNNSFVKGKDSLPLLSKNMSMN